MLLILLVLSLARLVTSVQEMTLAGIFDEGDTQYAEVFRQAVEDVNNNRYSIQSAIVLRLHLISFPCYV